MWDKDRCLKNVKWKQFRVGFHEILQTDSEITLCLISAIIDKIFVYPRMYLDSIAKNVKVKQVLEIV